MTISEKADVLLRLHSGAGPLVLLNAWDAASARVVEAEGYPAVATSSSGCAGVLGYADGENIPPAEMLFLVSKIAGAVQVPVTADVEAGYGDPGKTAREVIAAGAVGLNLEDMVRGEMVPVTEQVSRIREVRAAADALGVHLVINARCDVFLEQVGAAAGRFDETVARLNAYRDAGADSLFAPGVRDSATIGALVKAVRGPLNILATPGCPSIGEMAKLGVARISFGGGPARVALGAQRRLVRTVRDTGSFEALGVEAIPSGEMQVLLRRG
ncbi:MAG TPA: isocitrate lyase/phosphoenolpyruvate mutase family protein [Bryobacteraceae bacterium]|nr:isocitrate lyase/phosphoenolpyruvate mutase family protein [Bryobacteraceae bacterium]